MPQDAKAFAFFMLATKARRLLRAIAIFAFFKYKNENAAR